jgi:hypothetical protein
MVKKNQKMETVQKSKPETVTETVTDVQEPETPETVTETVHDVQEPVPPETVTETVPDVQKPETPETVTENVPDVQKPETPETVTENVPDVPSVPEPTLEPEPEQDAVLRTGQCPRCKHINSERAFIFPGVNRVVTPGVYEGVKYQIIETRRTKCEKCGQIYFIKKYL